MKNGFRPQTTRKPEGLKKPPENPKKKGGPPPGNEAFQALKESDLHLKAILNNIPDTAWLKDKQGRFLAVNEAFIQACGWKEQDILGKKDLDIWSRELAGRYRADDRAFIKNRKRRQIIEPWVDADGHQSWIETIKTPVLTKKEQVIGTTGIARDITERKKIEEKLINSERLYRAIFETTGTVMGIGEADTTISLVNAEFERVTGYSKEEVEGKMSWKSFIVGDLIKKMEEYHHARRTDPSGPPRSYKVQVRDRRGRTRDVFLTIDIIPGTGQTVCSAIDLTDFKATKSLRKYGEGLPGNIQWGQRRFFRPEWADRGYSGC